MANYSIPILKVQYYWKSLKKSVQKFVRHCLQFQRTNLQTPNYAQLYLEATQMHMDLISMDVIGPFKIISRGNQYKLAVICVLTNYVICVPLVEKSADTVVNTYLKEIYRRFGGSWKKLSDIGSYSKTCNFEK